LLHLTAADTASLAVVSIKPLSIWVSFHCFNFYNRIE
jgi:hypothetical protein